MKTLVSLSLFFLLPLASDISAQKVTPVKENKFIGTYNGLDENVEFEFITDDGKIYIFQEIGEEVNVDLYEEQNFDKKFEVIWITQTIELLDEEGEPIGEKEEIQEIISLKELKL